MKKMARSLMSWKRSFALFLLSTFTIVSAFAQDRTVSGTVLDDKGEPAIGATVMVKGTGIGTMTDFDGNYSLNVPAGSKELEVSYVGMETQVVAIAGNKVDVKLGESAQALEEVVATGYGSVKKRDVVTSVASVNADQIKNVPVTTAAEALQGKLTGVSVTATEGSPDADVSIRVRGGGSLTQSNEPLYIVDGFPVSSINDISPSDIQSMDVLKDAAATAIYGAQGANGVIIITTKDLGGDDKGDNCKMNFSVDYTGYVGWKNISKTLDVLDAKDFTRMQYENAAFKAIGKYSEEESTTEKIGVDQSKVHTKFNAYFDKSYVNGGTNDGPAQTLEQILDDVATWESTDWQDASFGRTGINSNHSVTIAGGNKNANFTASYNRIDDKAIMQESNYKRDNVSLKAKFKPLKGLTIGFTSRYSNMEVLGAGSNTADDKGSSSQSRLRNSVVYSPIELLKSAAEGVDDEEALGGLYDPLTTISDNYKLKMDQRFTVNGYVSYKFLKHFTLKVEAGYDSRDVVTNRFYGPTTYFARSTTGLSGVDGSSALLYTDEKTSRIRNANTFNYEQRFKGGHNFSLLVGEEMVINKGDLVSVTGYGFDKKYSGEEAFSYMGQSAFTTTERYIDPTDNMLSFFGRVNYDYKGRYYVTATFRADASTRFSKEHNNQWGYFPSAAVAWRMSDEPWMRSAARVAKLSNLKFRFSYGMAGNNNVDLGYLHREYLTNTSTYIKLPGVTATLTPGGDKNVAPNPTLRWETTITRNLGFDYGFFNDRLSGTFDVYWNTTKDLICRYGITGGYNYQYRNIGSTENKGIEFSVNGVILDKQAKDLNYGLSINANISANRNKVTDLGGLGEIEEATAVFSTSNITYSEFLIKEGLPMGNIYGYQTDGWYKASDFDKLQLNKSSDGYWQKDGKKIDTPFGEGAYPGLIKFKDVNGDGQITEADKTILGNTYALCQGGFSLNAHVGGAAWGRVDLAANFTYSIGNDVLNLNKVDYTTITTKDEKTSYRNNITEVKGGYSQFDEAGQWIPEAYINTNVATSTLEGDKYREMAEVMDAANADATMWSPLMPSYAVTDYAVEDASYLRLSSLTVGYSLPEDVLKKAYIKKIRLFFTASNLFTVTNYSGFDPEVDVFSKKNPLLHGVDFSAYPKSVAFNFGLNLSF